MKLKLARAASAASACEVVGCRDVRADSAGVRRPGQANISLDRLPACVRPKTMDLVPCTCTPTWAEINHAGSGPEAVQCPHPRTVRTTRLLSLLRRCRLPDHPPHLYAAMKGYIGGSNRAGASVGYGHVGVMGSSTFMVGALGNFATSLAVGRARVRVGALVLLAMSWPRCMPRREPRCLAGRRCGGGGDRCPAPHGRARGGVLSSRRRFCSLATPPVG